MEVLFLFTGITLHAQAVQINSIESTTETHWPVIYLTDTSERFTVYDAFRKIQIHNSGSIVDDKVALNADVYWIKFDVENQLNGKAERLFEFYGWTNVTFYQFENGAIKDISETGHLVPFRERDFPSADRCIVNIQLQPQESILVLVRLEKDPDFIWQPNNFAFKTFSYGEFIKGDKIRRYIVGLFTGIFLVMFLYNLFIYFITKDRSYLYYLALLLLMIIVPEFNSGFIMEDFQVITNLPNILGTIDSLANSWIGLFMVLFVQSFFNTKERLVFLHQVGKFLKYSFIALMIVALFFAGEISMIITNLFGLLMIIFAFTVSIKSLIQKYTSSMYFIIAQTSFLVSALFMILTLLGVIHFTDYSLAIVPAGSAIEMTLFSFALGNRINVLRKENTQKQQQIIEHLKVNQDLQTKVNRELEDLVAKRTKDIENQKLVIVEEKERSDNLLLNILPKATAEELKIHGKAVPKAIAMASILFTDIKGFTEISQDLRATDLVQKLDEVFKSFDEIITRNRLEKIKTIGDSYMCASGVPDPLTHNPEQLIIAGLEIQKFMQKWNQNEESKGGKAWELRIGIHSGPITAGVVGKVKFAYDIWGDTVNTASRVESNGEVGKVNVSDETYQLIKDKFNCTYRGSINVKGKGQMEMYFVESSLVSLSSES